MSNNVLSTDSTVGEFHFGEFAFDSRLRQLLCGGQPRQLSPKAQQLLLLLLLARPRVLTREELYDALWPSTYVCETNLASVVNELRRALGDNARAPQYIRTVHSFGYAFCGDVAASLPGARAPVRWCATSRSISCTKGRIPSAVGPIATSSCSIPRSRAATP